MAVKPQITLGQRTTGMPKSFWRLQVAVRSGLAGTIPIFDQASRGRANVPDFSFWKTKC